jgi:hypothetical protein
MTQLTKNFSLEEMTVTKSNLKNEPTAEQIHYLTLLCENVLQPLRNIYGKSIKVNSGFRSDDVNKAIGGVATSQHCKGQAADITAGSPEENEKLFNILASRPFDQLINEHNFTWVHVSFVPNGNRNQKLKFDGKKYVQVK